MIYSRFVTAIILLFAFFLCDNSLSAQTAIKYALKTKYPPGPRFNYKFTEKTVVERQNSKESYQREITYYFTAYTKDSPKDGFLKIELNIDSMLYRLNDGGGNVAYNSQSENAPPVVSDIIAASAILNHPFTFTYSPYGEIVDFTSENLNEVKSYVYQMDDENKEQKTLWLEALSPAVFQNVTNLGRNLIPETILKPDSVWKRLVSIHTNGLDFIDTATVQVKDYTNKIYTIVAKADSMKSNLRFLQTIPKPKFIDLMSSTGSAEFSVQLSKSGIIKRSETSFTGILQLKSSNKTQLTITSTNVIELTGQFKW